ncbi:hypothetical protein SAMN02983003_1335 [Devosia enhydra]|uniref:Uncharacterized protein n=1 Tax=Devosia enhydra TaxID=665118 RepID=A0A1K2HXA7_9HYPH|nr:hypothetical protein [Devosia enhydra]SFZ82893.1 hypothetical protein SAMN02983003_1335 [Devosia enhydra]
MTKISTATTAPRRPGRPRKNPLPAQQNAAASDAAALDHDQDGETAAVDEVEAELVPAFKGGRPRRGTASDGQQPVEAPAPKPSRSVIKPDYKRDHKPDDFAQQLSKAVADDNGRVDRVKLRALAEANGVWNPAYERLNVGQARMNVGNRLRAKARKGQAVVWVMPVG